MDDFDPNLITGHILSDRQEISTVNEGTGDQEFTVGNPGSNLALNENMVNVKNLERWFNERFDKEIGNSVDTAEDRIQNAILTAIDSITALKTS